MEKMKYDLFKFYSSDEGPYILFLRLNWFQFHRAGANMQFASYVVIQLIKAVEFWNSFWNCDFSW